MTGQQTAKTRTFRATDDLWAAAHARAQERGETVTDAIIRALTQYTHTPRNTNRTLLYIAGPMSDLPEFNYPAFHAAAANLRQAGYDIINPAELQDITRPLPLYETMLTEAIRASLDCDGIAVLPGWQASHGARTEIYIAHALNRPVLPVDSWIDKVARHAKEPAQ